MAQINQVLDKLYSFSSKNGFKGYNKHDGLNSPIMRALCGWGKWPRICAIQTVMRAPFNPRKFLFIPRTYNPKGLALFAQGLMLRHKSNPEGNFLGEAQKVLALLGDIKSPKTRNGTAWGYHYPWQDLGFFAPANTPNAVVTAFVSEAFLDAFELTSDKKYLDPVAGAIDFFLNDLCPLVDTDRHLCLSYMPMPMRMRVMDVSILIAAVLARYGRLAKTNEFARTARRLASYVIDLQTEYGAWFYTDPPGDSPIGHDNYHTGFILDALWRYMTACEDWSGKIKYETGLNFYAEKLFNRNGSPRWMSDRDYPHDIHGAAQGLLTFSMAHNHGYETVDLATRIYEWSVDRMYDDQGRFYYQEKKFFRKKFTLLRWCNAWMFKGMSAFAATRKNTNEGVMR